MKHAHQEFIVCPIIGPLTEHNVLSNFQRRGFSFSKPFKRLLSGVIFATKGPI